MTKRASAKYKIDRRMGENIWGRPKSPVNKREYGPGQHGQRRKGKLSDSARSSRPSRSSRAITATFRRSNSARFTTKPSRLKGDTSENLIGLLERRLDTLIYRAKFVATPFAARQFVNHGHVRVNGKRVTIPSYRLRAGDLVEVKEKSRSSAPSWTPCSSPSATCRTMSRPTTKDDGAAVADSGLSDVPYPVHMEPHQVVEFYSR